MTTTIRMLPTSTRILWLQQAPTSILFAMRAVEQS